VDADSIASEVIHFPNPIGFSGRGQDVGKGHQPPRRPRPL